MNQAEIVSTIIQTINAIFSNIFSSIDNSIYSNLDNLAFINSNILNNSSIERLLGASGKSGLIYLADAMLVAILLFYVVRYYYFNAIDITVEKPRQFIFKLLIFAFIINSSYFIFEQILSLNYTLSTAIQDVGKSVLNTDISFSQLIVTLNKKVIAESNELNIFSLDGIIKSFVSIGLINLLLAYSLRYILVQVLILFAPFAFLSAINGSTSWIFKSWAKSLFSVLILQIFVPIVIIVIFCIENDNKILYVGGIYALTKINDYIREMFGGLGLNVSSNISNMLSILKK